jgi:hypothetical protein
MSRVPSQLDGLAGGRVVTPIRAELIAHAEVLVRLLRTVEDALGDESYELVDELFRRYDTLDQRIAAERNGHGPVDAPAPATIGYARVVDRVRAVLSSLPHGARPSVVSRGDRALVDVPGREVWHFPRNEFGVWAGFHPADGADAVRRLDAAVRDGATHFVLPSSTRWWLEYYDELAEHLRRWGTRIVDDECVTVFEVAPAIAVVDPTTVRTPESLRYAGQVRSFREFAAAVLPAGANVLVVTRGDDHLLRLDDAISAHFPSDTDGVYQGQPADDDHAVGELELAIARGAQYLAMPAPFTWWRDVYPGFAAHLDTTHRRVADDAEAGALYALTTPHPKDPR